MAEKKDVTMALRLTPTLLRRLRNKAAADDRSVAQTAFLILRDAFDQEDK